MAKDNHAMLHPLDRQGQLHKRLSRLLWLERFRVFRRMAYVIVPLAVLFGVFYLDPREPGDKLRGTMTSILLEETHTGTKKRITITLDSGHTVLLSGGPEYREGSRVVVQEFTTWILGRHSYRFVSFEETE